MNTKTGYRSTAGLSKWKMVRKARSWRLRGEKYLETMQEGTGHQRDLDPYPKLIRLSLELFKRESMISCVIYKHLFDNSVVTQGIFLVGYHHFLAIK